MKQKVTDATNQKLRGGYYTPRAIADFLAAWAICEPSEEILEPSCGDGEILTAAACRLLALGADASAVGQQLHGIELYASEAATACTRLEELGIPSGGVVTIGDFFEYADQEWGIIGKQFDVAIGNPPFLRYQSFPEEQRARAFRVMKAAGLNPSRLTNSWLTFLVAASLRLKPHGRLAMVIPAELLQVKYAEETRAFLARHFGAITIITFRRLVFEGILQEVVLLLAEKTPAIESGIDVVELNDASDLENYEVNLRERHHLKPLDHAREKWTQYYLSSDEIALLRQAEKHPDLKRFKQLGQVDVGIVTGNNNFFVLNEERLRMAGLEKYTVPLVGRTAQLPNLIYAHNNWLQDRQTAIGCHLLNLPSVPFEELPLAARKYVRQGEAAKVHEGYKCSIRKPWYSTPSLWEPHAFLFRQIYTYPKLVFNCAGAVSTDTIHRVRLHRPQHAEQITLSYLNSLTFAFAEVMGRSYGGGVLELEPTEAEQIPVPFFDDLHLPFAEIERLETQQTIDEVLNITDRDLLRKRLGFDVHDTQMFRSIWRKLSGRRLGRGAGKTAKIAA